MQIEIITIFPELIEPFIGASMMGIAAQKGLVSFRVMNLRDFTRDKHRKVDDRPYGGGPGMVFKPGPVVRAVEAARNLGGPGEVVLLTPAGKRFTHSSARRLSGKKHLVLVCGHYEGFDERIRTLLEPEEISLGDFVLSGGEVAAMAVIEAVVRLIPGVLGGPDSASEESFETGLLDHPHYTRPPKFEGLTVPEILLSGDHERIREWRKEQALKRTRERRADLLEKGKNDGNGGQARCPCK
ncbi:MAG: tRNA (guanosine(37)-N1)-methyltransferase TrmD [Planctomycetota bacterium]|jgi:tRNA (guanine37-N1)-methyltransferase